MSLKAVQQRLNALGYNPGPIDGIMGDRTRDAMYRYAWDKLINDLPQPEVMRTSPAGIAAIVSHEGIVPGPYLDGVGVWTFGIGHTASAGAPDPATMARGMPADLDARLDAAFSVFARDLAKFEARVRKAIKVPLAQHEFDAAVSFDLNTGAIDRATWVKSLNAGDRQRAAAEIMNWTKPDMVKPRRQAEQRLFRDGVYPSAPAPVWGVTTAGSVVWKAVRTLSPEAVAERVAALS